MNEDDPDVVEAIKRLPPEEYNLRQFRVKRALDLSMKHHILPKELWTPREEVVNCHIVFFLVTVMVMCTGFEVVMSIIKPI